MKNSMALKNLATLSVLSILVLAYQNCAKDIQSGASLGSLANQSIVSKRLSSGVVTNEFNYQDSILTEIYDVSAYVGVCGARTWSNGYVAAPDNCFDSQGNPILMNFGPLADRGWIYENRNRRWTQVLVVSQTGLRHGGSRVRHFFDFDKMELIGTHKMDLQAPSLKLHVTTYGQDSSVRNTFNRNETMYSSLVGFTSQAMVCNVVVGEQTEDRCNDLNNYTALASLNDWSYSMPSQQLAVEGEVVWLQQRILPNTGLRNGGSRIRYFYEPHILEGFVVFGVNSLRHQYTVN